MDCISLGVFFFSPGATIIPPSRGVFFANPGQQNLKALAHQFLSFHLQNHPAGAALRLQLRRQEEEKKTGRDLN